MRSQTQRSLLLGFIGSISLCGVIGMYCLLVGQMTDLVGRVLATTGAAGAASILGLAAAIPWERRRWEPIGPVGLGVVAVALIFLVGVIWLDVLNRREFVIKTTVIACVLAVTMPHAGLLSLARLRTQYEWVRIGTLTAIGLLAVQIIAMVLFDENDEYWFRLMGAVAIADVCGTVTVPILHRISAIGAYESVRTAPLMVTLVCPRCSKQCSLPVGRHHCPSCGLGIHLEIDEEHCEVCGYVLHGIESAVCPECGTPIRREEE